MSIEDVVDGIIRNQTLASFCKNAIGISITLGFIGWGGYGIAAGGGYVASGIKNLFTAEPEKTSIVRTVNSYDNDNIIVGDGKITVKEKEELKYTVLQYIGKPKTVTKTKITEIIATDQNRIFRVYSGILYNKDTNLYYIQNKGEGGSNEYICSTADNSCTRIYPFL